MWTAYWHVHSLRRPTDHIQPAAFAFATGSKMFSFANGVVAQVPGRNWNRPLALLYGLTAFGSSTYSQRATRSISARGWPYSSAAA